jgi:hypothetical protein
MRKMRTAHKIYIERRCVKKPIQGQKHTEGWSKGKRLWNAARIICRYGFGQDRLTRISRETCCPRRHVKGENVLEPFPWQSRDDNTPKQFWKLGSCLFIDTYRITGQFVRNVLQQRHIILGCRWQFYKYFILLSLCWDGSSGSKLLLHASHVALRN